MRGDEQMSEEKTMKRVSYNSQKDEYYSGSIPTSGLSVADVVMMVITPSLLSSDDSRTVSRLDVSC